MSAKSGFAWLGLALLVVVPYLPGLRYQFVYDDHGVITENSHLDNFSNVIPTLKLQTLGSPDVVDGVRPVVIISYFLDRALWRLWPTGYHITNVTLHALVSLLVYWFALGVFRSRWPAFWVALLFAWHPLMVEPVQSPSFREDILCMLFGMIFLLIGKYKPESLFRLVAAMAAYVLALLTKESAVVFPVLLAIIWWLYPEQRPDRPMIKIWSMITLVVSGVWGWAVLVNRPAQQMGVAWNGLSFQGAECIWSFPWMFAWNVKKILYPHPLSIDYRIDPISGPFNLEFLAGILVVAFFVGLVWLMQKKEPIVSLSLAWMFIAFLPVSNLLPLFNPVADRYAYMLIPGFSLLIVGILHRYVPKILPVVVMISGLFFVLVVNRIVDWKDDRTLWSATLEVEPKSARAHTWIGLSEKQAGRLSSAWDHFSEAEMLNPHDPSPTVNKAVIMGEKGDLAASEDQLREVLQRYPRHVSARQNLILCLRLQGRDAEAELIENHRNQ